MRPVQTDGKTIFWCFSIYCKDEAILPCMKHTDLQTHPHIHKATYATQAHMHLQQRQPLPPQVAGGAAAPTPRVAILALQAAGGTTGTAPAHIIKWVC
jgi:hypothetical protein